ncbi:UNVERIFIED_CONTAM: Loganic acid O-methyltransferase [Sesamum radiatum]|uniref:Loganic acid O-methyltransferase n=1 Tax=Sesamum radiatum TaxID=300843 RepID=A0AAW2VP43_SESRA
MTCKDGKPDNVENEAFPRPTDLLLYSKNPGDGPHSYVKNSSYQGGVVDVAKPIIEEEIARKLDIKRLSPTSPNGFRLADFGCSTDHNSFLAMQIVTQAIYGKHASSNYNAIGVPGDFHGRLLPESSLQFSYSNSWALHWLSEVPKAVAESGSLASNKGEVCTQETERKFVLPT